MADLPIEWDALSPNRFHQRSFLAHAEAHNPCNQRYYYLCRDGRPSAGVVVYSLELDLFTFRSVHCPIRSNIVGIPSSVSTSGFVGSMRGGAQLLTHVLEQEEGFVLVLNLNTVPVGTSMVVGRTLPSVVFDNVYRSWSDYLSALRAAYRRRLLRLSAAFKNIDVRRTDCKSFDESMYRLYRAVLRRSEGKLETLSLQFFQYLPHEFKLAACYYRTRLIGWYISTYCNETFYFFLGGIDYGLNMQFKTYFNILFLILREAIERGAATVDFGQTAIIPKTRLGGRIVEKHMLMFHRNRILRTLIQAGKPLLEYSNRPPAAHVFRASL